MTKFKNKYRVESTRLQRWDYGSNGLYFVTICCQNMKCFFGEVVDAKMKLSPIGHIANSCWYEIQNHFSFIKLHNHIIMPNHIHGIMEINKTANDIIADNYPSVQTPNLGVSAHPPNPHTKTATQKWNAKSLGVIINQYKRACTINARKLNPNFAWHSNYHDHIIRNAKAYHNISNYIQQNPMKWQLDIFHSNNSNTEKSFF